MKLFAKFFNKTRFRTQTKYQLFTNYGLGQFYGWGDKVYNSDVIRSCLKPYGISAGKLVVKHIQYVDDELRDGESNYLKRLFAEPNPMMSMQLLQEKLANQLAVNNNAFALITRNQMGFATGIQPLDVVFAEVKPDNGQPDIDNLVLNFTLKNGLIRAYSYNDIIHLRKDFINNPLFGESPHDILMPLLDVIYTSDKSIINAIKNSSVVRWLLSFSTAMKPEDMKQAALAFSASYLKNTADDEGVGVAAVDASKSDAKQIEPKDYVPNAAIMDRAVKRVYAYFGTNEKIISGNFSESEWNAYYESNIEPLAQQMSDEFTRKILPLRDRVAGHVIMFEASSLQYADIKTKLELSAVVDRGGMSINHWRKILNLPPVQGGDELIRRLDTAPIKEQQPEGE